MATVLQTYSEEEVRSVVLFLSAKGLNPLGHTLRYLQHTVMIACAKLNLQLGYKV